MKAKPVKRVGSSWVECTIKEMTHIQFYLPSVARLQTLPAITKGSRVGTNCWTWDGDTEKPTIRPSVLVEGYCGDIDSSFRCHSWVNDGEAQFLSDCSHELANKTVELLDVV